MTKQVKYDKRVFLPKGAQRKFIESVQFKLDTGIDDIAGKIGVHRRTLFDWRREKYLISKSGLSKLSKLGGLPVPSGIKIKDPFWYTNLGANKGWFTIQKRCGMSGGRIKENFKIEIFFTLYSATTHTTSFFYMLHQLVCAHIFFG